MFVLINFNAFTGNNEATSCELLKLKIHGTSVILLELKRFIIYRQPWADKREEEKRTGWEYEGGDAESIQGTLIFHLLRGVRWTGMAGLVHIKALSPWLGVTAEQGGSDVAGEIQCELSVWRRLGLNASLWFSDKVISRCTLMGQSFPLSMDGWTLIKNSKGTSLFLESKRRTLSY